MNGTVAAVLVPSIATIAIMGMVTFAGGRFGWSSTSPLLDSTDGEHATCHDNYVRPVGQSSVGGTAWLCLTRGGIKVMADLEGLATESTYTTWLGYFDRPDLCPAMPCAESLTAQERAAGIFERLDSVTADLGHRASISRSLREIQPAPGAQVQVIVFQLGPLAAMRPAERVRLLIDWPLDPARGVAGSPERRNRASLVARATIKLYETPQSSDERQVGAIRLGASRRGS